MSRVHTLKCWPEYFEHVANGTKRWELRHADRGFEEGDYLCLKEWNKDRQKFTGRVVLVGVVKVWRDLPWVWGFVVLDIRPLTTAETARVLEEALSEVAEG